MPQYSRIYASMFRELHAFDQKNTRPLIPPLQQWRDQWAHEMERIQYLYVTKGDTL